MKRIGLFAGILLGLCAQGLAQEPSFPLNQAVQELAAGRTVLQGTSWAAVAAYVDGEALFSIQPQLRLAPASTLKLLISAAALQTWGPMYQFQTQLYADALPDKQGTLPGNLYIRGGADPTLGSGRVKGSLPWQDLLFAWSKQLQQAGIKRITGGIYADTSLFSGPSVPDKFNWQNMGNYFAAPVTALAFNDNQFTLTFAPQPVHGAAMHVEEITPQVPGLQWQSFVTADAQNPKDNAYVYGAPRQYELVIYGTLPASLTKHFSIRAALPQAPLTLAQLLTQQLQQDGIAVEASPQVLYTAPDYHTKPLLYTHYSPALKDILYVLNKRSFNFYAEMLLRSLAVQAKAPGTTPDGAHQLKQFWQSRGVAMEQTQLYDGSGLSRDNQVTVQVLLQVLQYMAAQPEFKVYYDSLATLQERGDLLLLSRLMAPLHRTQDVHVKGGTIDGVKAQAGYVKDKNGRLIAFAFIANNLIATDESINRFYEDLLKLLLNYTPEQPPLNKK